MNRLLALLVVLLLSGIASPAAAHDTWLQPRRTSVSPGAIAQIDLTSGDKFATFDAAIKPDRIAYRARASEWQDIRCSARCAREKIARASGALIRSWRRHDMVVAGAEID